MSDQNVTSDDPYTEPDNSTVDDWHGQELNREQERADELVRESGGDVAEAEERFEQETEAGNRNA